MRQYTHPPAARARAAERGVLALSRRSFARYNYEHFELGSIQPTHEIVAMYLSSVCVKRGQVSSSSGFQSGFFDRYSTYMLE